MYFRLRYGGKLKGGNSKDNTHIQSVRRSFHQQLKKLWTQTPVTELREFWDESDPKFHPGGETDLKTQVGNFTFVPLVTDKLHIVAQLEILLLRPAPPGALFKHGGDLDNRIKTLIDALRVPATTELPAGDTPAADEAPFFCLLSDDKLITGFSVESDRLLDPTAQELDVQIVIKVRISGTVMTFGNASVIA